ncbi:hypothetical protein NUU61_003770 [Penicillium alfredii]|uniref:Uncharacterized protein n=1 Tax=Penicillium alfredii TaxID=1506179 RepID=A0A9W9KDA9_9EURO|nr:uncharacterized protein NUU61_003770 [Penicillium alfredii]KAJ5101548.1 hypothetical protein NUU61_003770 [Penicillium alfredii]
MEPPPDSLLYYLSVGLPAIPVLGATPSKSTASAAYSIRDIREIAPWPEFNYSTILDRFGPLLNDTQIPLDNYMSPPHPIKSEKHLQSHFSALVMPRVRRALRAGLDQPTQELPQQKIVAMTLTDGTAAKTINQFVPDTAFVPVGSNPSTAINRAPGDLKVSWKWKYSNWNSDDRVLRSEYLKTMAQVNFHMAQHGARHGFILTDTELVAIKRLDTNGRLAVAEPIPWTNGGIGQLSVLLGLWYIGMLAAEDTWSLS